MELKNAGFEASSFNGWVTSGKGWTICKDRCSEGACCAQCLVGKGDGPGTRACLQKLSGVEENRVVEVSLALSGVHVARTPHSKAYLAVLCVDVQGNVLKEYRSDVIMVKSAFQTVKVDDAVVLAGTKQIYVMLVVKVYAEATDEDMWRFDDVKLQLH
jgi:hypothetical protein